MAKTDKVATVAEITDRFRSASAAVITEYRGLTMAQLTELRRSLGKDTAYTVAKNTLVKRAAADAGVEGLDDLFVGPTAVAFISGEPVDAAKALRDFAKTHPLLVIKGGLLDGRPIEPGEVNKLADLESREVLLGKLAGAMLGTLTKAAYVLNALPSQVARLAAALQDKRVADGETLEVVEAAVVEAAVVEAAVVEVVEEAVEEAVVEAAVVEAAEEAVVEAVAEDAAVLEAAEETVVEAVAEDAAVLEAAVVQAAVEEVTTIEAVAEEILEAEAVSGDSPADEAAVVEEVVDEAAAEEAEVIEAAAEEIAVIETAADEIVEEVVEEAAVEEAEVIEAAAEEIAVIETAADEIVDEIVEEAAAAEADATDSVAGDGTDKDAAPEA